MNSEKEFHNKVVDQYNAFKKICACENNPRALRECASSYYDAKKTEAIFDNKSAIEGAIFNLLRKTTTLAGQILSEFDDSAMDNMNPEYMTVNFIGNLPEYEKLAPGVYTASFGGRLIQSGNVRVPNPTMLSTYQLGFADAKNKAKVNTVSDLQTQGVIDCENKTVLNALDLMASASGHEYNVSSLDIEAVNNFLSIMAGEGYEACNCIISSDLRPELNNWDSNKDPFTKYMLTQKAGGATTDDYNSPFAFIDKKSFMGLNWISIPYADGRNIIKKGTMYLVTAPSLLGKYKRTFQEQFVHPESDGSKTNFSLFEKFACAILNSKGVIKVNVA